VLNVLLALVVASAPPPPVCTAPDGARIRLELAQTDEEHARGLMYRDSLPEDAGMLFVFDQDGRLSFWMKDTFIPLDMVWLTAAGDVVDVRTVQPCRIDPCPTYAAVKPARAVLELNAGVAAKHGVKPGTRLRFDNVPAYPVPEARK
jgi:uncharacterized protein